MAAAFTRSSSSPPLLTCARSVLTTPSGLFSNPTKPRPVFTVTKWSAKPVLNLERGDKHEQKLAAGLARFTSEVTQESAVLGFAAIERGDFNPDGRRPESRRAPKPLRPSCEQLKEALFARRPGGGEPAPATGISRASPMRSRCSSATNSKES